MPSLLTSRVPAALLLIGTAVAGGCSSNDSPNRDGAEQANPILEKTRIESAGVEGILRTSPAPLSSDSPLRPEAFSAPDFVLLDADAAARIELGYRAGSPLEKAFVTTAGETGHIELDLFAGSDADEPGTGRQSVILTLTRADPADDEMYCYKVKVRDDTTLVSEDSEICTVPAAPDTPAERVVYLSSFDDSSTLSTLSLGTGAIDVVGQVGVQLTDIAFLEDELYGVTSRELLRIDPTTAEAGDLLAIGASGVNALEAVDGQLVAATTDGVILRIDPRSGVGTAFGALPAGTGSSGDLVLAESGDKLLGTVRGGGFSTDALVEIDVESGVSRLVGETGFESIWGLGIARDQLVGLTIEGDFLLIDPLTAETVRVERTAALSASGASLAP